jgi:hypothetical protein
MRFRPLITCLLTLATFATTAAAAQACTETWTGNAGDGSWNTANNWSPAQVPQTTDSVCITAAGTYTVTLPAGGADFAGADIASLTLGASSGTGTQTLDVVGQDYYHAGEIFPGTTLTLNDSSTITSSGELILDSTSGGYPPGSNPAGGYAALNAATLTNSGKIVTQSEDPSWPTYFAGSLTEEPSASLDVNSGTFTMPSPNGGGYGSSYGYSVTNGGSMDIASGAGFAFTTGYGGSGGFINNGTVINNGSITANSGGGQVTWTQSGGSESGNPVVLQAGAWLVDSAGAGSFLFNYESGELSGTIPAGQTVTVQGEVFNSGGEDYNSTGLGLDANSNTAPVTNDGTLVLDAPGSGSASGGSTFLNSGTLDNNGTFVSQVEDSTWNNTLQASIVNGTSGKIDLNSGELISNGGATSNSGAVTVAPGALWSFNEAGALVNEASGTIVPEIASATSYGSLQLTSPCCNGPGAITAGGTLAPKLVGGFTPTANEEFPIVALDGGTFTGKFASVGSGFGADYTKEAASPAFVGVIYGQSAAAAPPLSVGKISASGTKLSVKLSCGKGAACSGVKIAGSVTEHLKRGKVKAVTASAHTAAKKKTTKVVVVVSASAALAAGATKTISIKLNATGRKLLARFHKLTVLTTVRIGAKTVRSVKVVFHAPKKR